MNPKTLLKLLTSMQARKLFGAGLIGVAVGGSVINGRWYRFAMGMEEKAALDRHASAGERFAQMVMALEMDSIAQASKTMSKADKEKIHNLAQSIWATRTDAEKLAAWAEMQETVAEIEAQQEPDDDQKAA